VLVQFSARGKASGLEVEQIRTGERTFSTFGAAERRGSLLYLERERALADLGLAPDVSLVDSRRARMDAWHEVYEGWARDS
jgi:hypothetical protein